MTETEHYVVRAAWQVMRDMGLPLETATEFRTRLEAQIDKWHADDGAVRSVLRTTEPSSCMGFTVGHLGEKFGTDCELHVGHSGLHVGGGLMWL